MGRDLIIFPTPLDLARGCAAEMAEMINNSDKTFTIALSGGSTPELLFKVLSDEDRLLINWKNVHLFWGDERCVLPDDGESNYGMAKKELIDKIPIPSINVHRMRGEDDPETETRRYAEEIQTIIRSVNGLPSFDLVILGLGEDGHTASIFPGHTELLDSEKICDVAIHPSSNQKRLTITGKVINNAVTVIFLVAGKMKSRIIADLFHNTKISVTYPAAGIIPVHGVVKWFVDSEAAILL